VLAGRTVDFHEHCVIDVTAEGILDGCEVGPEPSVVSWTRFRSVRINLVELNRVAVPPRAMRIVRRSKKRGGTFLRSPRARARRAARGGPRSMPS
jgi:hypothetical protein